MVSRRQFLQRSTLSVAGTIAVTTLPLVRPTAQAAPAMQGLGLPLPDPDGLLDLPAGFSYQTLIRSGEELADGLVFPPDPDLGAVIDLGDGTFYLVIGHEIRADLEYEDAFTGSATRLRV